MEEVESPGQPYLPDRIAAWFFVLGFIGLLAFSLIAQRDLSQLLPKHPNRYPPVSATSIAFGLLGLGALGYAALGVARSQHWAFGYLFLVEFPRALDLMVVVWGSQKDFSSAGAYLSPFVAAAVFSVVAVVYTALRGMCRIGRVPIASERLNRFRLDVWVGLIVAAVSLFLGLLDLSSVWNWAHDPEVARYDADVPIASLVTPYIFTLFATGLATWIALSLARSKRWAFWMSLLMSLNFVALALHGPFPRPGPSDGIPWIEIGLRSALMVYCVFRLRSG